MLMTPGEIVETEPGYLRGHGTYIQEGGDNNILISSVCGRIERINKLISVVPNKHKYTGEIGDLIVGRISGVDAKRWKVDINSTKDANLQLSSVNLADGSQRIRTHEDSLQMRTVFTESDLISAEIQNINSEGIISLHTRSLKYGKLENGQLIQVPSVLIPRLPQHFISFEFGIDVLLGVNGYIWITRSIPHEWLLENTEGMNNSSTSGADVPEVETLFRLQKLHAETVFTPEIRLQVCRVHNAISLLASARVLVTPEHIRSVYFASLNSGIHPSEMLISKNSERLLQGIH